MEENCVFCKIAKGEIKVKKIYEDDNFISFPDAHPKVKGHSLVISKKHFETMLDMPSSLGQELIDCIKDTSLKLMSENKAQGFNILNNNFSVAGQVVKHIHFHILPRKHGESIDSICN